MFIPISAGTPSPSSPGPIRPQRLLRLESLLKSGPARSVKCLADMFGVGQRTIRRDIRLLRQSDIRVIYDPKRGGYRALGGQPNSDGLDIEVAELVALVLAVKHLNHLPEGLAEPCNLAIAKVVQAATPSVRQQALAILDLYPPSFESRPRMLELPQRQLG